MKRLAVLLLAFPWSLLVLWLAPGCIEPEPVETWTREYVPLEMPSLNGDGWLRFEGGRWVEKTESTW